MKYVSNNAMSIDHVSDSRCAQSESSPDIVKPGHLALRITAHGKRDSAGICEPLDAFYTVRADSYYLGVVGLKGILEVYKLPGLRRSTMSKGSRVEIENQVGAPEVR